MNNPYSKYQEQSVMTMTNGEMLVRLYDEVARQIKTGIASISNNDVLSTDASFKKAQTILKYLTLTLDRRYPVSQNLADLYEFFSSQIILSNSKMDAKPASEVLPMVEELRETFSQAEKLARLQANVAQPTIAHGAVAGA